MTPENAGSQNDWLATLAEAISAQRPEGELIVSSGHSPSGVYHIGTLREIMTASAITWQLRRLGRKARHIDFVDDFDAFRKVPATVPEAWSKYLGQPLAAVPDPFDCHESYGDHYLSQLHEGLALIGAMPDETMSGYINYREGVLVEQIRTSLNRLDEARAVLTEVGGRALDEHWAPVQILSDAGSLRQWRFAGWDAEREMVAWTDRDGNTGEVGIANGQVKLDWRLDWPARWAKFGVAVEPFGRDHATKGGSYDTGKVLVDRIFGGSAPYPVPYEFINTVGQTKKMSKSSGDVLTPQDALNVMPPEIIRYFIVGGRPGRTLAFDSGLGLYNLIENYSKQADGGAALAYAQAAKREDTISSVPFSHLVAVYQAARRDSNEAYEILQRTGYAEQVEHEREVIEREFAYVANWLDNYAPESVKFEVQDKLPNVELSDAQVTFLDDLADRVEAAELDGQGMHDAIYAAKDAAGLTPGDAFTAIYRVLLGKDAGPKAGWFLSSLDRVWLAGRLRRKH